MWNWQQTSWPYFEYDSTKINLLESNFLQDFGFIVGVFEHLSEEDKMNVTIDLMSTEAVKTSAIEGEVLDRDSVQSSLRRSFGLDGDFRKIPPAERGVSRMMLDLYQNFDTPLSHEILFEWHRLLMNDREDIANKGAYRNHSDPMQVVSGKVYDPVIHFEAPPSSQVSAEMEKFVQWFNATAPGGDTSLPVAVRAAIAHLYFVSIHPFEDGNGRISRALSEKVLSQSFKKPALLSFSYTIEKNKKDYYLALEQSNKEIEITSWVLYFSDVIEQSREYTQERLEFLVAKTRFYDRMRGKFNTRQEKVIHRMFLEGIDGFTGGLSANNYASIAKTSAATATRDLNDLVKKEAFRVEGKFKSTRYYLKLD